jgi:hypothetical protein
MSIQHFFKTHARKNRLAALALTIGAAVGGWTSSAAAFGVFEFGAGMLPPPTPYGAVELRTNFYSATSIKDGSGNTANSDVNLHVLSIGTAYIKMTDVEVLGAKYGFGAIVPFLDIGGHLTVRTPVGPLNLQSQTFKLGDIQVFPVMLQWQAKNLFINAAAQIQAPTGGYDVNRLFNPGANHWSFAPVVGVTYLTEGGFELSSNFELDVNTVNPKTKYRSGVEFKHEFAVGQHIGLVTFHSYKEFGARNRSQGIATALRVAYSF